MNIGVSYFSAVLFIILGIVIYFNMKKHTQEERNLMLGAAVLLALILTLILTPIVSFGTVIYYRVTETSVISKISTRLLPIDGEGNFLKVTDTDHDGEEEYTFAHLKLDGTEQNRYKLRLKDEKIRFVENDRPAEMERIVERMPDNLWTTFIGKDKEVMKELDLRIVIPRDSIIYEDGTDSYND